MESKKGMFRLSNSTKDKITLILPLLWVGMIVFVFLDLGYVGMYLTVIHGMISATLGLAEGDYVNKKLFTIFVIGWGVLMFIALTGMIYYAALYGNEVPDFMILGMHPSAFYLYGVFWIGNLIYLSGFLVLCKDTWLPKERWDAFVAYAQTLDTTNSSTVKQTNVSVQHKEIMEV